MTYPFPHSDIAQARRIRAAVPLLALLGGGVGNQMRNGNLKGNSMAENMETDERRIDTTALRLAASKLGGLSHHSLWLGVVGYPADYTLFQTLADHMLQLCADRLTWLADHPDCLRRPAAPAPPSTVSSPSDAPAPDVLAAVESALEIEQSQAARDVLVERRRQISTEGWTPDHDDEHKDGALTAAAVCYAFSAAWLKKDKKQAFVRSWFRGGQDAPSFIEINWPWDRKWWKPKDRRRDLVKAGALILAEIERLDRATLRARGEGNA